MKYNIKKPLLSLIIIMFLATRSLTAYADIIYEPNDSFYQKNRVSMKTLGREFTANSTDGNVKVFSNPNSKKKDISFENGTVFFVSHTYTSILGTKWGIIEFSRDTDSSETNYFDREAGWVKMDDLVLVYDDISFTEDHQDEFTNYNNEFDSIKEKENLLLWTYPGSGVIKRTLIMSPESYPTFSYTYTDENDRVWGYINYYLGKGGWICFSSPSDENLLTIDFELDSNTTPDNNVELISNQSQNEKTIVTISIVLVSTLVILTILIIRKFWPNNQSMNKK